jgi:hypothetical protein
MIRDLVFEVLRNPEALPLRPLKHMRMSSDGSAAGETTHTAWELACAAAAEQVTDTVLETGDWRGRYRPLSSPAELRRELREAGQRLTVDELKTFANEAHAAGLPVRLGADGEPVAVSIRRGLFPGVSIRVFPASCKDPKRKIKRLLAFAEAVCGPDGRHKPIDQVLDAFKAAARVFAESR